MNSKAAGVNMTESPWDHNCMGTSDEVLQEESGYVQLAFYHIGAVMGRTLVSYRAVPCMIISYSRCFSIVTITIHGP